MGHRTWIKMCGITRLEDALAAVDAGVDALGFVFADSPRRVTAEAAHAIVHRIPRHVLRVAVFVDETPAEISRVVSAMEADRVQIHGFEEPTVHELLPTRIVKAFRVRNHDVIAEIEECAPGLFLLDTWRPDRIGGTGETFDWDIARRARDLGQLILAGGLTPENVGEAIRQVAPFGVDVSSGIETQPGIKDPARIRAFAEAVRAADAARAAHAPEAAG